MNNFDDEEIKFIGRKRAAVISHCSDIFFLFNPCGQDWGEEFPLDALIEDITQIIKRKKKTEETGKEDWENWGYYYTPHVAFAIGYVLGLSFEIEFPEIKDGIEKIRKVIREKHLLPYLPREKKGGGHDQVRNGG